MGGREWFTLHFGVYTIRQLEGEVRRNRLKENGRDEASQSRPDTTARRSCRGPERGSGAACEGGRQAHRPADPCEWSTLARGFRDSGCQGWRGRGSTRTDRRLATFCC